MTSKHREILDKLEEYLNQPGAEHLRFWQALYGAGVIKGDLKTSSFISTPDIPEAVLVIRDDFNLSDNELLKRMK